MKANKQSPQKIFNNQQQVKKQKKSSWKLCQQITFNKPKKQDLVLIINVVSYYAFLPTNRCKEEFSCNLCNVIWLDKLFLLKIKDTKSDLLSSFFQFVSTQECPRCNSKILKNGGCSHVTCKKCHLYYCWIYNNQLINHVHNDFICFIRKLVYITLILFNIGLFLLYNSYIILPIALITTLVYTFKQLPKLPKLNGVRKQRFIKSQIIFLIVQTTILILQVIITYYKIYNITLYQFLNYHYYQFIIIFLFGSITILIKFFYNFLQSNWLKYLI
ncbi:unnamed protein product [Paramecium sonneborni]|uniref:RING-type domain-containing protein n=1 Tax=Paramecium sonneborni TaxID=65129 RepID=A0A8S1RKH5_9CILI|nr:unnamed protein product [Paramecium sonneborni]